MQQAVLCAAVDEQPYPAAGAKLMFGTQHLTIFVLSGILLNLTPGQDTFYIVGRSMSQGRRAGLLSVMGISSGAVVHTFAAAFGLSAILAASANAFAVVKLVGAAYLVYLGIRMLFERKVSGGEETTYAQSSAWEIYRSGFLTNLLNPKVALFFMAFLPQFVSPATGSRILSFLFLGGVFIFNGTLWCLVLVWGTSAMSRRFRQNLSSGQILKRATGALFVGLGLRLAVSK
jgi:threonine/homoserine/homoserine lactone efflux protein